MENQNNINNFYKNKIYYFDDFIIVNGFNAKNLTQNYKNINMLILAVCTNGQCTMKTDDKSTIFSSQNITVIPKEMKVSLENISNDFNGYAFLISEKFYTEILFINTPNLVNTFIEIHEQLVFSLNNNEFNILYNYNQLINEIIEGKNSIYTKEILRHIFTSLTLKLHSLAKVNSKKTSSIKKTRQDIIVEKLLYNIASNYRGSKRVEYYAEKQCLSAKYLTLVTKSKTGRTVSEWISLITITEAKNLLRDTNNTIQEVANELGFNSQSFFGKYFKKHSNISPSAYRKSL